MNHNANTSHPHSRRHFLGTTLGAASLSAALVAPNIRAAEATAPVRKIKLGVVGNGGRGGWIAKLFQQHGGYEMWAVADYFQSVADSCGNALGVDSKRRFSGLSGYKKVIESGIEAIALEAPPFFFPEHARAAVDAGLHVYMAKPVAVDTWGCLEIEAAAQKAAASRRVFLVDYQMPTDPHNIEVVKMVRQGELGPVATINSHYLAGQFADPPLTTLDARFQSLIWCNDVAIGGGYHVNACIHAMDAALWIAGQRPTSCCGASRIGRPDPHGDSHDVFQLVFQFADGLILNHRGKHINNQCNFNVIAEAQGQTGYAQICYGGRSFLRGREDGYAGNVDNLYEAGAVRNIAKFHKGVVQGDYSNDTVRRSIDGALTTILGREAARRGRKLTMDELLKEKQRLEVDLKSLKT